MGSIRHPCPRSSPPPSNTRTPFNMWTHLKHQPEKEHHSNTGNNICMVLDDKLMAQHRRVLGGLLSDPHLGEIRPNFFFCLASRGADVVAFCRILLLSWSARTLKAPSCFLRAKGQAAIEWRVTLLLVGGVRGERAAAPDQRRALRTGEKQLGLSIATCRSGVSL